MITCDKIKMHASLTILTMYTIFPSKPIYYEDFNINLLTLLHQICPLPLAYNAQQH